MNPPKPVPHPPTCEERTKEDCEETLTADKKECLWTDSCKPKPTPPGPTPNPPNPVPHPKYCEERNKDECTATPRPNNKGECIWVDDDGKGNAHGCMNPPKHPPTCEERKESECVDSPSSDGKTCVWSDNSCHPE
jgi:hypothetical protein